MKQKPTPQELTRLIEAREGRARREVARERTSLREFLRELREARHALAGGRA